MLTAMGRIFSFERDPALTFLPLSVRRKLDLAGLKLSLAGWQALPLSNRRALVDAEVDDDTSAAFAAGLRATAAGAGIALDSLPAPTGPWPWRAPAVPPALGERLAALGLALEDTAWAALPDEDRYALLKLAGAKREPERLRDALSEIRRRARPAPGLVRCKVASMSNENERKLLADLAATVREKVSPTGEALVNREGIKMVERLARNLTAPGGMPGLKLWRDTPTKFRLQRPNRNAEIMVEWQRDIGAMVMTGEKFGESKRLTRYVFDQEQSHFRRMEGEGELYEDMVEALVEYLYPEGRREQA